jgi:hypothetical protein
MKNIYIYIYIYKMNVETKETGLSVELVAGASVAVSNRPTALKRTTKMTKTNEYSRCNAQLKGYDRRYIEVKVASFSSGIGLF